MPNTNSKVLLSKVTAGLGDIINARLDAIFDAMTKQGANLKSLQNLRFFKTHLNDALNTAVKGEDLQQVAFLEFIGSLQSTDFFELNIGNYASADVMSYRINNLIAQETKLEIVAVDKFVRDYRDSDTIDSVTVGNEDCTTRVYEVFHKSNDIDLKRSNQKAESVFGGLVQLVIVKNQFRVDG